VNDVVQPGVVAATVLRAANLATDALIHGFSTRQGGVSRGSCASLDFSANSTVAERMENHRRLAQGIGYDGFVYRVHQVHGDRVVKLMPTDPRDQVEAQQADGIVTAVRGRMIGVLTADCVPLLLADPVQRVVGVAHAGWRGAARGIVQATVGAMRNAYHCDPKEIQAAIGPCIRECCCEVGSEVAINFEKYEGVLSRVGEPSRIYLDLPAVVIQILRGEGLEAANVSDAGLCTACRADLLFSYRRDGAAAGRHLSAIGLR
jgi:YfiH family protein